MNKTEWFIALRMLGTNEAKKSGTKPVIGIALLGISLSVAVMLISVCIVLGFQKEIREKVIGFSAHIQVSAFNYENSNVFKPISKNQPFYPSITQEEGIESIHVFALKEGILKTESEIYGLLIKGIDRDFNQTFFQKQMIEGDFIQFKTAEEKSNDIILSKHVADKMQLRVGDPVWIYFFKDDKSRPRKFLLAGIYDTGLEKFDKLIALCDIKHIVQLQGWTNNEVGGFEIILSNYEHLNKLDEYIYKYIPAELNTEKVTDKNPDIFGWLELQDINVIIILLIMIVVACINMATALLVWIMEKVNFIGIMKALGATEKNIRNVFIIHSGYLLGFGLILGNAIGLSLALGQKHFKWVKLDKASYYLDAVPVLIEWPYILWLNLLTAVVCLLVMLLPASIISKIKPSEAIRFN